MSDQVLKNVEAVILAGGKGSRLYPLTKDIPKSMVKIGEYPVIEHIVRYFHYFGINKIKILIGHKGEVISHHFKNNFQLKIDIECIPTGEDEGTAERLWKVREGLASDFLLSYSDILFNVNLEEMWRFHRDKAKVGTISAVPLRTSYGIVKTDNAAISLDYLEKPVFQDIWMNGGLFIFKKTIFDKWDKGLDNDFSRGMLPKLAKLQEIAVYQHKGFWSGMDTVRENEMLNELWKKKEAEWALWRK